VLRANAAALGLDGARVVADRVERFLTTTPEAPYDVVLADPPYALDVAPVLGLLADGGWLADGAVLVVERSARDADLAWPAAVTPVRSRRYGETTLWYGKRS
jgi:16S rRNA (guanine966-N2)-methyltransferase